jgi:opacity protein-like surface antigen
LRLSICRRHRGWCDGRLRLDRCQGQPCQRARVRRLLSQRHRFARVGHRAARLRLGSLLGYVKAGASWEEVDYSASTILIGTAYRASDPRSGWTIGGGGEYAITRFLSGFLEYSYYDFDTETVRLTPQLAGLPTGFLGIEETTQMVRAGLNLRFGP